MHIDPANAAAPKTLSLDQAEDFLVFRHTSFGQLLKQAKDFSTISHGSARQFAHNERMHQDFITLEQVLQFRVPVSKVIHPHRGIYQGHALLPCRLLGTGSKAGSEAPSSARRRALSVAISASSPFRTREVFSVTPVSFAALFNRSSSIFNVVLICTMMYSLCIPVNRQRFCRDTSVSTSVIATRNHGTGVSVALQYRIHNTL
jgi:hypothetical protein